MLSQPTPLGNTRLSPRAGVVDLMATCRDNGILVALCTSTSRDNVDGLRLALDKSLPFDQFATIVSIDNLDRPKPAPDAYLYCLDRLGIQLISTP